MRKQVLVAIASMGLMGCSSGMGEAQSKPPVEVGKTYQIVGSRHFTGTIAALDGCWAQMSGAYSQTVMEKYPIAEGGKVVGEKTVFVFEPFEPSSDGPRESVIINLCTAFAIQEKKK